MQVVQVAAHAAVAGSVTVVITYRRPVGPGMDQPCGLHALWLE